MKVIIRAGWSLSLVGIDGNQAAVVMRDSCSSSLLIHIFYQIWAIHCTNGSHFVIPILKSSVGQIGQLFFFLSSRLLPDIAVQAFKK